MDNGEYFDKVGDEFDLTEEMTIAIGCAKFFIESMGMDREMVLSQFNLSAAQFEKYKSLPES